MIQQFTGNPGILAGNNAASRKYFDCSSGDVTKIANWRGNNIEAGLKQGRIHTPSNGPGMRERQVNDDE